MICDLFFECINGEVVGVGTPTALSNFLMFMLGFTISFMSLVIFENRTSSDDTPAPVIFIFIVASIVGIAGVFATHAAVYLLVNRPVHIFVGALAALIFFIFIIVGLRIRQRKWK